MISPKRSFVHGAHRFFVTLNSGINVVQCHCRLLNISSLVCFVRMTMTTTVMLMATTTTVAAAVVMQWLWYTKGEKAQNTKHTIIINQNHWESLHIPVVIIRNESRIWARIKICVKHRKMGRISHSYCISMRLQSVISLALTNIYTLAHAHTSTKQTYTLSELLSLYNFFLFLHCNVAFGLHFM